MGMRLGGPPSLLQILIESFGSPRDRQFLVFQQGPDALNDIDIPARVLSLPGFPPGGTESFEPGFPVSQRRGLDPGQMAHFADGEEILVR